MLHDNVAGSRQNLSMILLWVAVAVLLLGGVATENPSVPGGILSGTNIMVGIADGFRARMTELGYIEGRILSTICKRTETDPVAYRRVPASLGLIRLI